MDVRKRLYELVEYVEELVKQADRPVFKLSDYDSLLYYEADLKGRVGIHHDLVEDSDGPIWLKIERLKRIDPPVAPESIREWLAVSRDPFREPVLESVRVQTMPKDEVPNWSQVGLYLMTTSNPLLRLVSQKITSMWSCESL